MRYINHRINTIDSLKLVPIDNGVEIDIRYHNNELVLHHDPLGHHEKSPEKFEDFLKEYNKKGLLILNIKTEGVEQLCIDLMNKYQIKNWAFLDLSMPYFVKYANAAQNKTIKGFGPENLFVRFSEFEPIEYALAFKDKAKWVWVDCFTKLPINDNNYEALKNSGFNICLVSPELQGHDKSRIAEFKKQLKEKRNRICLH